MTRRLNYPTVKLIRSKKDLVIKRPGARMTDAKNIKCLYDWRQNNCCQMSTY